MKKVTLLIIFLNLILYGYSQESCKIKEIEIYALNYQSMYFANVDKRDLKKEHPIYVKITDKFAIERAMIPVYLTELEINSERNSSDDYRAKVIIHYNFFKKEVFYLTAWSGEFVKGKTTYKANYKLVAALYSFLPEHYYVLD